MGRAEYGTAKYASKQMKARGLQKLKFYCQVCQKQCRDDNGFKLHIKSPSHVRKISQISQADIEEYTKQFENDFLRLMRLTHGEKKIEANKFYNEYIQDKDHIHMNATRFTSLTKFIKYLGQTGKIRVHGVDVSKGDNDHDDDNADADDDVDMGQLIISYIDNSQRNLLRREKLQELAKNEKSDQEIKMMLLQRQMESAAENAKEDKEEEEIAPVVREPAGTVSLQLGKSSSRSKKKPNTRKNVFQ
ncbi:hypothetical protein ZYGR_0AF04160 [Zygosaccharomyces rouxii]|uniref:C2H2-type domain-containing protein n=1 Tax=Zygosaccharomyces rouxii TaxID=4956 RepID=A0A1Q3A892_ZYGRO|nr:hypothetical protein ZYGR_0AF04160 [Zygosaccharomyces rouxii]